MNEQICSYILNSIGTTHIFLVFDKLHEIFKKKLIMLTNQLIDYKLFNVVRSNCREVE